MAERDRKRGHVRRRKLQNSRGAKGAIKPLYSLSGESMGILLFDHRYRPLVCSRTIKSLCGALCRRGSCVLERDMNSVPELLQIVKSFRSDMTRIENRKSRSGPLMHPHSIIYLSPAGELYDSMRSASERNGTSPTAVVAGHSRKSCCDSQSRL
jgi:hypothetical protein